MNLNNPQIISVPALEYQYDNVASGITSRQKTWQLATMIPSVFGGKSVPFNSRESNYKRMIRPRQNAIATVATVTPSTGTSTTLTLTFVDGSYDKFRKDDVIRDDKTNIEGKVLQHYPGGVVIGVQPGTAEFDATTHFQPSSVVRFNYNRSRTFNSGGTENRFWENEEQVDYSDITNETIQLARNEEIYSYIGKDGNIYVWSQQIQDITDSHMNQLGMKYWFSKGGSHNPAYGYETSTVGIRERIILDGTYYPEASKPTLDTVVQMAKAMADKNGTSFQDFLFVMGRDAMYSIQNDPFIRNTISNAGTANTIGGASVQGLNVMQFTIANMKLNFLLGTFLSDSMFLAPSHSYSIYGLDLTPIPTLGSGGMGQSPLMKIHRGNANDEASMFSYVPGKRGIKGLVKSVSNVTNSFNVTASNVDGDTYNVQSDCGISFIGDGSALYEYTGSL